MHTDKSSSTKIQETYANIYRNGRRFYRILRFLKGFYGLADTPTIFQERINTTLEHKHPTWLDDIIIATKGNRDKHERSGSTRNNDQTRTGGVQVKPKEV